LVVATSVFSLAGCGGGGSSVNTGPNPFAGNFVGTGTLDGGKPANLTVAVGADSTVQGSVTVTAPPGREPVEFPTGTHEFTGTADLQGNFNTSGSLPGGQAFTVKGKLPSGATAGSFEIQAGDSKFMGQMNKETTGGGDGEIQFSNANGVNCDLSPWAKPMTVLVNSDTQFGLSSTSKGTSNRTRTLRVLIDREMAVGSTVSAVDRLTFSDPLILFAQFNWVAASGTITLVSKDGDRMKLRINGANMGPAPGGGSAGTFTINGELDNTPDPNVTNVAYSDVSANFNGVVNPFTSDITVEMETEGDFTIIRVKRTVGSIVGSTNHVLSAKFPTSLAVGASTDEDTTVFVSETQFVPKVWAEDPAKPKGTIKLVERSATKIKIELINFPLLATTGGGTDGEGSFTLNGNLVYTAP